MQTMKDAEGTVTMNERIEKAFNEQINRELSSEYLYLAMAAHLDSVNLPGSAHWMRAQAAEEHEHAMKFYRNIVERGGRVVLMAIPEPPKEWDSVRAIFQAAYEHECKISRHIHDLVALARKEGDIASEPLLAWFVEEQIEEEASTQEVVNQLEMLGVEKGAGLIMLDVHLGKRGK